MDIRRSSRLRGLAVMVSLTALMVPAGAAEAAKKKTKAKQPVVTSVRPMDAEVGDTLTIHGKHFRPGKGRNTVVFRRDGAKAIFVKADVSTRRMLKVVVPESLLEYMTNQGTVKVPTQFRIRILAKRFGKSFTTKRNSPTIGPDTPPPPPPPPGEAKADGDCDGNGVKNADQADDDSDGLNDDVELSLPNLDPCKVDTDADGLPDKWEYDCDRDSLLNRDETDDDGDLLSDDLEAAIMTDPCSVDSDADGVQDGYEYRSAVDLNDDDYQSPNESLPYPGRRAYPNPLNKDAETDYDGDGLWLVDEYKLWIAYGARDLTSLNYSDGKKYSRTISAEQYDDPCALTTTAAKAKPDQVRCADGSLDDSHAQYLFLQRAALWGYSEAALLNMNGMVVSGDADNPFVGGPDVEWAADAVITEHERYYYDLPYPDKDNSLSDDERDGDADGIPNWMEAHGYLTRDWWENGPYGTDEKKFTIAYAGTAIDDPDSDGDGVVDGADDQDHDDVPNVRELSRLLVAGENQSTAAWTVADLPAQPNWLRTFDAADADAAAGTPVRAWVNPFNPCLPNPKSRTCPRYVPTNDPYPPFDPEYLPFKILN